MAINRAKDPSNFVVPLWLNGKEVTTSRTLEVVSPLTGEITHYAAAASESDAQAAIESCAHAFPAWSSMKPSNRRDIFLRAADLFVARQDECYKYAHEEVGESRAMFNFDYAAAIDLCRSIAGLIQTVQGSIPTIAEQDESGMVFREPYGVVLGIAPWNAPYVLGLRACLQALAVGNTVVLKGPEAAPRTYWAIASVLHAAGLPAGCLNTIYHRPGPDAVSITTFLISSPTIKKLNFTGSSVVGASVASLAGKNLKPVLLELGGKSPSIVCDDADIRNAAKCCALAAFLNAGQICMSTERIIVSRTIFEPFKDALKAAVEQYFSDETPVLVNQLSIEKNKKLLVDAVTKGAGVVYGEISAHEPVKTHMKPVVLENVTKDMSIYYTESFGPTVSIFAVDSDEDALTLANDTEHGLSSAIFTEDLKRGLRMARRLETGAVHINNMSVHDEACLPHGGVKKSGFGRFNGREGLEEWVRTKAVTWKD